MSNLKLKYHSSIDLRSTGYSWEFCYNCIQRDQTKQTFYNQKFELLISQIKSKHCYWKYISKDLYLIFFAAYLRTTFGHTEALDCLIQACQILAKTLISKSSELQWLMDSPYFPSIFWLLIFHLPVFQCSKDFCLQNIFT